MGSRLILAMLATMLLVTSQGMSQYSAKEDFAYPSGTLLDSLGNKTPGWGGPWVLDTSNAKTTGLGVVADTGFDYTDLYTTSIPYVGNELVAKAPGNWASARYKRALDKVWPDVKGQYWASFLFDTKKVPSGNTYYLFKLFAGSSELVAMGKGGGGTTYTCGSGWPGGSGADVSTTQDQGGPVWLVTEIFLTGTKKDTNSATYMWINPDPTLTTLDTSTANVKRYTTIMTAGFDSVAVEWGGADTNEIVYDEIRLGTSFANLITGVKARPGLTPTQFALSQNYPNPFNPTTRIEYSVPQNSFVTMKIYNVLGQEVMTLFSGTQRAGNYVATFDGSKLASGVYFYRLEAGTTQITKKLVLLK